jgi:Secretion system C-terminal sorting domain
MALIRNFALLSILVLLQFDLKAQAGCIYAQRGISSFTQQILVIDPITGNFDTLSTLNGFAGGTSALAIDSINSRCFFSGYDVSFTHYIYTMSLSTGQILQQPMAEGQYSLGDLQYNLFNGLLYTITSISSTTAQLLRIDPATGNYDTVGVYGGLGGGTSAVTLDVIGNKAFFLAADSSFFFRVYTVDLINGNLLSSPILEAQVSMYDPQFKFSNQLLYTSSGISSAQEMFLEVDPATGNCDTIGIITGLGGGTTAMALTENDQCVVLGFDSVFNHRVYSINLMNGTIVQWPIAQVNAATGDPSYIFKCVAFNPNSIAENEQLQPLPVYPNPTSSVLNFNLNSFSSSQNITILIWDNLGQLVWQQQIIGGTTLQKNISEWSSGLYFYQVLMESEILKKGPIVIED